MFLLLYVADCIYSYNIYIYIKTLFFNIHNAAGNSFLE